MPKLKFLDMKTKKTFETDKFVLKKTKKGGKFAQAVNPSGGKSVRFVAKNFKI